MSCLVSSFSFLFSHCRRPFPVPRSATPFFLLFKYVPCYTPFPPWKPALASSLFVSPSSIYFLNKLTLLGPFGSAPPRFDLIPRHRTCRFSLPKLPHTMFSPPPVPFSMLCLQHTGPLDPRPACPGPLRPRCYCVHFFLPFPFPVFF